jgi:transposase
MSGKRYTDEFKVEAVKQVTERGHSVAEVAERLGITTHSLRKTGSQNGVRFEWRLLKPDGRMARHLSY